MQYVNGRLIPKDNKESFFNQKLSDLALYLLIGMAWVDSIIVQYIKVVISWFPIIGGFADEIIIFLYILFTILSLPIIMKNIKASDLILFFVPFVVCIITAVIYPQNIEAYYQHMPVLLFTCVPLFLLGVSVDWEKHYKMLYYLSILAILARFIYAVTLEKPMTDVEALHKGDMWSAYLLLPHVCLVGMQMFKKPNALNIGIFVLGTIFLFSLGSRGPLLCLLAATLLYLLFYKKYKKPITTRIIFIIVAILLILLFENILDLLYDFAKNMGMSVRFFELYKSGDFFVSKGRDYIRESLLEMITQNPIFGYGIYSDRINIGSYAHSFYIELWLNFGIVLGSALFIAAVLLITKTCSIAGKGNNTTLLVLTLTCASFMKLFLSGSYLEEPNLYLLIGLCIMTLRKTKALKEQSTKLISSNNDLIIKS